MSIIYLRSQWSNVPNNCVSKFLKIGLSSAKIVDPDEMQHYAVFHLGLHYLQKYMYSFSGFQNTMR